MSITAVIAATLGFLLSQPAALQQQAEPESETDHFETAIKIIKKYEGMSTPAHYPFVGHGHLVLPGEKFPRHRSLTVAEADRLLRADLRKLIRMFNAYGKDSILLGVLAYNIGPGNVRRSAVLKKIAAGNRDIRQNYLRHTRHKGKVLPSLQRRRTEEFNTLYIPDTLS